MPKSTPHQPVLLSTVLELLKPAPGEVYLDLTAGYGGHARAAHDRVAPDGEVVLVDRDHEAVAELKAQFENARIIHKSYLAAIKQLAAEGFKCDMVLLDLGVSSPQLEKSSRGFSFKQTAPLDMRMDQRQKLTAADIVNKFSEKELADLIYRWGEERRSRQVAKAIVDARPFTTTTQLAEIISRNVRGSGRIHPATRSFQALRIAVNEELQQLEATLPLAFARLNPGGRLAVISFHSLEDRIVKNFIKDLKAQKSAESLSKKPFEGRSLDPGNPRARSAKLRAVKKAA